MKIKTYPKDEEGAFSRNRMVFIVVYVIIILTTIVKKTNNGRDNRIRVAKVIQAVLICGTNNFRIEMSRICTFLFLISLFPTFAYAQSGNKELKFNLNESGSNYFKANFTNQVWFRYNRSNPGTQVFSERAPETFDVGLRRTRFSLYGQITDFAFLYFQFGQNNFNFSSPKQVGFFIHDAVCEIHPFKNEKLKVGGGLTIASGLSRMSQPSIGTILTMDVPVFAQATTGHIDQFTRRLAVYARGQIGKFDYRVILSDPFRPELRDSSLTFNRSSYAYRGHRKNYQGYFFYQFFEKEPNTTPYMPGTYLGKKRIFNIGAGFIYQDNAMWHLHNTGRIIYEDLMLMAVDAYLDMPLNSEKGDAISAYIGLFHNNYGNNYIRNVGSMNPGTGLERNSRTFNGPGTAYPMMGTGEAFYAQFGYLLPSNIPLQTIGRFQPYFSTLIGNYEALSNSIKVYNVGVNFLMSGHKSKLSLDYQNRPVYFTTLTTGKPYTATRRGQIILQYQISI